MSEARTGSRQGWTVNIQQVPTLYEDEVHVFMASIPGASNMTILDLTFTWDFGDQHANSSDPDKIVDLGNTTAAHTYTRLGTYSVGLTVKDSYSNVSSASVMVLVENVVPTPDIAIMRRSTFEDEPITFMATGQLDTPSDVPNLVFSWAFDNEPASGYSNKSSVERTYPQAGTHTVTLKVKDEHGAVGVVTKPFNVDDQPPLAIAGSDVIAYQDRPVQFDGSKSIDTPSDMAALKFSWDFGDGTFANGSMVSHQFKNKGQSIVKLTVSDDDGASTTDQLKVTVLNSPPIAKVDIIQVAGSDFVVLQASNSTDSETEQPFLNYYWSFGDGITGMGKTVTHRYGGTGTFSGHLTVTDPEGASSTAGFNVTVTTLATTPGADFHVDSLALTGRDITFDASYSSDKPAEISTLAYAWSFGDGTTDVGKIITHNYSRTGDYKVNLTVTNRFGVASSVQKEITIISSDLYRKFDGKIITVEFSIDDMADGRAGISPGEKFIVTGRVSMVQGWHDVDLLRYYSARISVQFLDISRGNNGEYTNTVTGGRFSVTVTAPMKTGTATLMVTAFIGFIGAVSTTQIEIKEKQTAASPVSMPMVAGVTTVMASLIAIGAVSATDLGRYKFFTLLIPLFTRLRKPKILDHFERGRIYEHIRKTPGDSYSSIRKALGIKNGALAHHLRVLEVHEYIISRRDGMYKRFYPKGMRIPEGKHKSIQEQMLEMIMGNPKITQKEMAERLGIDRSTVNYHIKILMAMGVIRSEKDGTVKFYYFVGIKEPLPYEG